MPKQPKPAFTQKWLFQKLLLRILNNWLFILLPVIIAITAAYLFNRYQNKVYRTGLQVIKGQIEQSGAEEVANMFATSRQNNTVNIQYERAFITSLPLLTEVVRDLALHITYYSRGRIKTTERYGPTPVKVQFDEASRNIPYGVKIQVVPKSAHQYALLTEDEEWQPRFEGKTFRFGEDEQLGDWKFKVSNGGSLETGDWIFVLTPVEQAAQRLRSRLSISLENSYNRGGNSILQLSMQSTLPHKDRQILDQLLEEMKQADIERKAEQSGRTIDYIDERMAQLSDSMRVIAARVRALKLNNNEVISGSESLLGKITLIEDNIMEAVLMNRYVDYLEDFIRGAGEEEIMAPSTFGINNDVLNSIVGRYIDLYFDAAEIRNMGLSSSLVERQIKVLDKDRKDVDQLVLKAIDNTREENLLRIREFNRQIGALLASARSVMHEELALEDFERLYNLNENIYTMLMGKKVEAGMTQSATLSDYSAFQPAGTSGTPIRPQTRKNYIQALFLGLLIPIGFMFLITLNRNTILSLAELEELVALPVAGVIGFSDHSRTMVDSPKSLVSENFRSLRANLRYATGGREHSVFIVTSSVSAEGKTYISANMAASMAFQEKRTILIGADMRKPSLDNYYDMPHHLGLSQYLIGDATLDEVIVPGGTDHLDVIFSGPVPPNPAELLSGARMKELITLLRQQYDAIFIDTPPIGLISDASELFTAADTILMVTRQQKTPVATLQHIEHFIDEASLKKTMLIFNFREERRRLRLLRLWLRLRVWLRSI